MKRLMVVFMLSALAGCASYGVQVAPERMAGFKKGETTEADVVAALGNPTSVTDSLSTGRMLMYTGATAQARPASFIPFIGPLVGGTDVKSSMVMFHFGRDGKLVDINANHSQYGSGSGFAAGTPIPQVEQQPRRE